MNETAKRAWLEALRSGEFHQGVGALRREDLALPSMYCCLGVLCEVAIAHGVELDVEQSATTSDTIAYNGESTYLPDAVIRWAGLGSMTPEVSTEEDGTIELAQLNDSGRTFEEIAALIEENL